jgi:NADH:ubiquinone oxidoreductase subunit E
MGSACHQQGVYGVLPRIQELLEEHGLTESIELKGAFCLGPCTHGVVLQFEDRIITNVRTSNVDQKFKDEILPCLR